MRALGHEICAEEVDVCARGPPRSQEHRPDIAIVALHESSDHALDADHRDRRRGDAARSACSRPTSSRSSSPRRPAAACSPTWTRPTPIELQGGIDIAFQRYHQFSELLEAFHRRARIERAKGLLMERHGMRDDEAFERIRSQARSERRPIMSVVEELLG